MNKASAYQEVGAQFLAERRFALLADEPGVGKTVQAILAADRIIAKRILVICPAVARVNWRREFLEWSVFSFHFTVCEKLSDKIGDRCIVSYDFATENAEKLMAQEWDLVIADESHFIKEPEAKRTQKIYGKNGIIRKTDRFWCLSGTPAPNHIGELWPMLYTFGFSALSYDRYISEYCDTRPTFYGGQRRTKVVGTKRSAIPEIKKTLDRVMLRRLKSEVLKDLPPITYEILTVEGSPLPEVIRLDPRNINREKWALESAVADAQEETLDQVLAALGNSMSTLRRYVGLQKVKAIAEIVSSELEHKAYEKIVLFAIHTDVIGQLELALKKFNPAVVNGRVSPSDRQIAIDNFQNEKDCQVFIGNISAAGTAITLTAAHHVLFVEQSWTPGENSQAAQRCHRRGQTIPVTVRMASLADSIDEKVTAVLKRKTEQLTQIFDVKSETTHLIGE